MIFLYSQLKTVSSDLRDKINSPVLSKNRFTHCLEHILNFFTD